MASGGMPHQPLPAAFLAHFGKDSHGHTNAGLLDSRGPAAAGLPPPEIHPRHIVPDERDAFISWLRGEFAAANAIIDAMCHHLRMIGESSEYDFLFTCIQQRRYNWTLVLHMQQFFSVAEVIYALQQATWRKQQARNVNQLAVQHQSVEDVKDPRPINTVRGLKGEVSNAIPQSEVPVPEMSSVMNRDLSLSDLSLSQEVYSGKILQYPVSKIDEVGASQNLPKSAVDPVEQSSSQVSPDSTHRTMPRHTEEQEPHIDAESKVSTAVSKSPGSYGGKIFSTDFTVLSNEEQDARLPMIKVSKHFQCWEHIEGILVNVVEGLELYENVLNNYEASQVAHLITEMQAAGRRGELGGKTFAAEKRVSGSPKETIQFGTENNKSSGERMQPMPVVFNSLIDRLILWHILPASRRPDYCCIEVLEEGEVGPPFLNYKHVDQYFCCLFLMAESTLVLGHNLTVGGGDYKSRFKLLLPPGSALVIQGNSATVASRAVVASPAKRIVVTFAKLISSKVADGLPSGTKFANPVLPSNSVLTSAAASAWPPMALPVGGVPACAHGMVPAMMKQFGMANASGVLPIPPVRPFSHAPPHHIPQHLVTAAPGSLQGVVPAGPVRPFQPMGVLSSSGWSAIPPRAPPPRPLNTGTGVFFPSSGSPGSGSNVGRPPMSAAQMQAGGVIMVSPLLPKSEPLVAYAPPTTETMTFSLQASRNPRSSPSSEVGDHTADRAESYAPWHSSPGSSSEPVVPKKGSRKDSSFNKAGANGNTSNTKDEQQQRGGIHRPNNKAGGGKN